MRHLAFLLEGPSEQDAIEAWLPALVNPEVQSHFMVFEGKQDLEKRMEFRMRHWRLPDTVFIVVRDQDSAPCTTVKRALKAKCRAAGRPDAIVRIACHELENFFLGDWAAVAKAFEKPALAKLSKRAIYRTPDDIAAPVAELRRQIPDYQKRDGARRIARCMNLDVNASRSFQHLRDAIRKAAR